MGNIRGAEMEIVIAVIAAILFLAGVILLRAFLAGKKPSAGAASADLPQIDTDGACRRLSGAIQIPTVSYRDRSKIDYQKLLHYIAYLRQSYPNVFESLEAEVISNYNLLLRWPGSDPSEAPTAFLAHMDVVPVEPSTLDKWPHAPFSGDIAEGWVWGRGAIDDKGQMIATLEAVDYLLHKGFRPKGDLYLAFAHDEELMGQTESGALEIVHLLKQRGIRLRFVLDEGGAFCSGKPMGVPGSLALISICEKGYVDIEISASSAGGHASMPPPHTALGKLCTVAHNIEKYPAKPEFTLPSREMFRYLLPYMNFKNRIIFSNLWLFSGMIKRKLCRHPQTAAIMRSTCAVTMASGSTAANVLPQKATLTVNMRVAPGKTVDDMKAYIKSFTGEELTVTVLTGIAASPVASTQSKAFRDLYETTGEIYPDRIIAPYPLVFGTDSRHYSEICGDVYKFTPFECMERVFPTMHGLGEHIEIESFEKGIQFFIRFIEKCCG